MLIVDDDGTRARTCESLLERVSMWSDAGWWIYPTSASIGNVREAGQGALPSLRASFDRLALCGTRLAAPAAQLDPSDLVSAYDLVLCVDLGVLEEVRAMARASGGDEDAVLCMTDFLAFGGDRMACLDDGLQDLVAPHYSSVGTGALMELPAAYPSNRAEWEHFLAASALTSAGVVGFLKECIDDFFLRSYEVLLQAHFGTVERASTPWEEAEAVLRRHQVTGGLDPTVRRDMFEAHCVRVRTRAVQAEQ